MANFLLIHGAWQGKWVWPAVSAELTMRGHEVHSIDLPGSGEDATPLQQVSLSLYADTIVQAIQAIGKRVTLVGHSMGGIAVTAAAERAADSLARVIYLCAFVPGNGDSLASLSALAPSHQPALDIQSDAVATRTAADSRVATFMQDAPYAVAHWAAPQFQSQAIAPMMTPVEVSPERYGKVPKSYIVCTQDRAIDPVLQRVMAARSGCARIKELESGHSPFLSRPSATAEMLHRMATEV
ncbi:alpha/beta fold hydrolase [Herbaspirillum rubrisubalbicans]|uniref:Alpha/beta hydrolase n=1 Tax=Herbaspirillum rubrisubalbicans TaxID=80842 RepID=A0AAD0U7B8_9BURK|nr:alpha/beta hydrolase [Herbaspirillum rubrisubalbicans]ALU89389.1 hydrolases or acyltransferases (alpha/beta hydrolase superfamily) [Herbaspirillum rubrisubalbicans M1]AYR24450.1 alpha/beta hydrolase [Herbaspirillum rubrisubalbicans]